MESFSFPNIQTNKELLPSYLKMCVLKGLITSVYTEYLFLITNSLKKTLSYVYHATSVASQVL